MGGWRSHRANLSFARPVCAQPPPLWVFSVITMEMLLRAFHGVKLKKLPARPATQLLKSGCRVIFLNCYFFFFLPHTGKNSFSNF